MRPILGGKYSSASIIRPRSFPGAVTVMTSLRNHPIYALCVESLLLFSSSSSSISHLGVYRRNVSLKSSSAYPFSPLLSAAHHPVIAGAGRSIPQHNSLRAGQDVPLLRATVAKPRNPPS